MKCVSICALLFLCIGLFFTALGQDLTVTDIDFSGFLCANDNVSGSIGVTISNTGSVNAAGPFEISLQTDGCLTFANQSVNTLAANSSTTVNFPVTPPWTNCADATCSLTATADANGDIAETDETNNQRSEDYTHTLPDLVVNSVTPSVNCITDGNLTGSVTVNVGNRGAAAANNVVVRLLSTCGAVFADQTVTLSAGSSANVIFYFTPNCINCTCIFIAIIDPDNLLCECSAANNSMASIPFTVPFPDIVIQTETLAITGSNDGQTTIAGYVTLQNMGCGVFFGNIPMRFTLYDNTGCSGSVVAQWTENFSSAIILPGGGIQTFAVTHTVDSNLCINTTGCTASIFIEADFSATICECDGTNNTYCANNKVINIPDLEITSETLALTCIGDGQAAVSGTVTLQNNGCGSNILSNIPMRFTLYDNTGCAGGQIAQWTRTFSGVNIAAGGGTQVFTVTPQIVNADMVNNSTNCQVSIRIEADYSNSIAECDGTDNTYCADKSVSIPDLVINSVTPAIDGGGNGSVTVNVGNTGCAAANNIPVRLTSNCGLTFPDQTINLAAGTNTNVEFSFTPTAASCTFTATADPDNVICESNGTNNTASNNFSRNWDFGDAPDPVSGTPGQYPTLLANNGPRHNYSILLWLGTTIDMEADGQPTANADGDGADEDGVLPNQLDLTEGRTPQIRVQVFNNTGNQVTVRGWIDYNGNGIFEAAEATAQGAAASGTVVLVFPQVPAGSSPATFARFRIASNAAQVNDPVGYASDGEVEDYQVTIQADSDNDGIGDVTEGTGDRDGDNIPNHQDYDPSGWIYNENTGGIITGGTISITPSTGVNIIQDGSGGFYQFTIAQAGTYILTYTPPAGFVPSALCPPQANPLDPNPTDPNPLVVGLGSRDGASMTMTNYNCGDNPYYMTLVLEPGDPVIINNNIPLTQQPIAVTLVSFTATAINNFVILTWQTGTEINHAGFNLYRSSRPEEGYEKMNPALIASRGNATGGYLYEYQDQPPQNGTWYYKLQDISTDGKSTLHAPVGVEYNAIPLSYALHQNHPNPFNPSTRIRYELPESGYVSIRVYDTGGRLVRTLVAEQKTAGVYFVTWDRSNESGMPVPSGIYFYRMTAGEFSQTRKMTVIK